VTPAGRSIALAALLTAPLALAIAGVGVAEDALILLVPAYVVGFAVRGMSLARRTDR
jgi:hypothetical protein